MKKEKSTKSKMTDYRPCDYKEARQKLVTAKQAERWQLWFDKTLHNHYICNGNPMDLQTQWLRVPLGVLKKLEGVHKFKASGHFRNACDLQQWTVEGE